MIRLGAAMLGVVVASACAYYNTLYNSERLFAEAEAHRRAGRDSLADARYRDVIRKTAEAYRGQGGADQARTLFLLGRAQLSVGRAREAHAALREAAEGLQPSLLRSEILVHLGAAAARLGDPAMALAHVQEAMGDTLSGRALGEAYLLRGRLRLQAGTTSGWEDLDRAAGVGPGMAVAANLERLGWGITYRDLERARSALALLLIDAAAAERLDTISALAASAGERWSPSVAATLLGDVLAAPWDRAARTELALQRARLLHEAGDREAAEAQAWQVARGRGDLAVQARLLLSRWHLDSTRDLGDAQAVVPILLPVASDVRAVELIEAVEDLESFSGIGLDNALGWFAAAEVARNELEAPILARGLYLAYADTDPEDPWAPKALLAALSVARDEEDRSWLRARLEAHPESPYVQAAWGTAPAGFELLEEELQERLREIAPR